MLTVDSLLDAYARDQASHQHPSPPDITDQANAYVNAVQPGWVNVRWPQMSLCVQARAGCRLAAVRDHRCMWHQQQEPK